MTFAIRCKDTVFSENPKRDGAEMMGEVSAETDVTDKLLSAKLGQLSGFFPIFLFLDKECHLSVCHYCQFALRLFGGATAVTLRPFRLGGCNSLRRSCYKHLFNFGRSEGSLLQEREAGRRSNLTLI